MSASNLDTPSDRYRWLVAVREREARRARIRALRSELAAARAEGKARRHARRLREEAASRSAKEGATA